MRTVSLGIILLVAAFGTGCTSAPERRAAENAPAPVATAGVELTEVASSFEAGGVVRARATAVIASRVMAPVTAVHVRAGDRVKRGAALATLDARAATADSARAAAALASAVESARAAEADTRAAEAALVLARTTHERVSGLYAKRSATSQELDQAVAALGAADAQRASAQSRAAAANAAREAAQAAVEAADVGVSYTVLSAPFDGLVTERAVDPGSMAAPGTPLLTLEDTGMFRLEVQLDEARARLAQVGESVDVRADEGASGVERWRAARISEIARIDSGSHSFLVKIDLPADPALRSGRFARARFPGPARRVLTVPASAILRRGQLTLIYTVGADGVPRMQPVTTGDAAGDRVEILAGVHAGDRVVESPGAAR